VRSRLSGWLGIGLIVSAMALYGLSWYWPATRTLLALDIPISLSRGHIRTGEFKINLQAFYSIEIVLNGNRFADQLDCDHSRTNSSLRTRWAAKRNGKVAWQSSQSSGNSAVGCFLGSFSSKDGQYDVDIDVLSDSEWLNSGNPRLKIEASWWDYHECSQIADRLVGLAIFFVVMGVSLFVQSHLAPFGRNSPQENLLKISSPRGNGHRVLRHDLPLMDPALMLPRAGNMMGMTYLLIFLACAPFILGRYWWSHGIPVRLLRSDVLRASTNEEPTGLLVYVDARGNLYLGSKPVAPEELSRSLEYEFARRADWVVYVEGDSDTTYMAVVRAMDLVRVAHGKVILLTPKMRAERKLAPVMQTR
jgi:biopolymer transport protein ExbD